MLPAFYLLLVVLGLEPVAMFLLPVALVLAVAVALLLVSVGYC